MALSHTHDLLTRESWEGASLREVFDVEMMALGGDDRVRFDYAQDIRLSPKAVVAIGMAIHELATNAAKYGALSTPEGRLKVDWVAWRKAPGRPCASPGPSAKARLFPRLPDWVSAPDCSRRAWPANSRETSP
jgi:hypothetical protein